MKDFADIIASLPAILLKQHIFNSFKSTVRRGNICYDTLCEQSLIVERCMQEHLLYNTKKLG